MAERRVGRVRRAGVVGLVALGALLGVVSRIEETTSGFSVGLSSNASWLGVAFLTGAMQRRAGLARAAAAGCVAMTVANASYYAWIAATEPGVPLASVAGLPAYWFMLGVFGGALFGLTGGAWAVSSGAMRVAWSLPISAVWIADGIGPHASPSDAVAAALGFAFPIASAGNGRERLVAGLLAGALVAVALTGRLEAFLP